MYYESSIESGSVGARRKDLRKSFGRNVTFLLVYINLFLSHHKITARKQNDHSNSSSKLKLGI